MDLKIIVLVLIGVVSQHLVQGAPPAWGATTGTATVAEDAAADTAVTITATPSLTNTPTAVEILSTSTAPSTAAFSVALNAGADGIVFKVQAAGQLDRETAATLTVNLRASNADGDTSGSDLVLTVTVSDANDNDPVFNPMFVCASMMADTAATSEVAKLSAIDADTTANGLGANPYALSAASTVFSLATDTGTVTVSAGQTLTAGGSWTLMVTATDQGSTARTATGTLSVCVGSGCCSGSVVIHGAAALIVLGLLSLFL